MSPLPGPKPSLDRSSADPLFRQLARWIQDLIRAGSLAPGYRLPAIRDLARDLKLNRATVLAAYQQLERTKVVRSRVGSGTFVAPATEIHADGAPRAGRATAGAAGRTVWMPRFSAAVESAVSFLVRTQPHEPTRADVIDFSRLMPDERGFPVQAFNASLNRVLARDGAGMLGYGPLRGHEGLRALLARRMTDSGTPTTAEQILITNGAQQAIELVVRTFVAPGQAVALGMPTYHLMLGLLRGLGVGVQPVRGRDLWMDEADLARALERDEVRLLYAMPTFHNPTGLTWDGAARARCLALTDDRACPVLEDEFQQDLRFAGEPQPSLRALCPGGRVVSVGSLSKGLFPGVRLGWVVASEEVIERMAALRKFSDLSSSLLVQAALSDFVERGALDDHVRELRVLLERRHAAMQKALAEHLSELATWTRPEGGYLLWLTLRRIDARSLAAAAHDAGVLIAPGHLFDPESRLSECARLSVSCVDEDQIEDGIARLAVVARKLAHRGREPARVFM